MATQVPAPAADDSRLQLLGTFASPALEQAYRARCLPNDLWLARACVLGAVVRVLLGALVDCRALAPDSLWAPLGCRLVFLMATAWVLVSLRSSTRLFFAWCLLLAALTIYFVALRVPAELGHVYMTTGMVLFAYAVVPLPLARKLLLAVPFSIGVCAIVLTVDRTAALTLGAAFVLVNGAGLAFAWQLNRQRRLAFLSGLRENQLCSELQQALAEVKTLRGHIPICAWCKSIRDKDDAWLSVESYVKQHTHAEFSHGICPVCVRQQLSHAGVSP